MQLNLGSGTNPQEGFINVDMYEALNPDVVFDLETFPWPWEDNSVDHLMAEAFLEHVGQTNDQFLKILGEMYRICKPNATMNISVPHPWHYEFLGDPTHCRAVTAEQFAQFDKDTYERNPLREGLGIEFKVTNLYYVPGSELTRNMTQEEIHKVVWTQLNAVREIRMEIMVIKQEAEIKNAA